ncbi:hypothetical protein CEUSTIGMA_g2784.t1 [Chlamydomonas eustigma]|uniref:Uncharacterized protein n=1 Tax=Chlamydomonas eustigma TaxID=1157962 RepID=A0A250WXB2_9CHLO|nr:hypothetical protein CEUSTIGMA_g2784.t1 [Chlamydomonas eustigma]|eukprot:GAX75339.1 hypothetical protein CEUSTIGMA_g2784.t1 [Chlamydomonas eustigma]
MLRRLTNSRVSSKVSSLLPSRDFMSLTPRRLLHPIPPLVLEPVSSFQRHAGASTQGRVATGFRVSDRAAWSSSSADDGRTKLRIAVDVDEVLGRFVYTLNQFCRDKYGMEYDVKDYWIYEYAKIWKCSQDKSNEIVHEFFKSPHFSNGIPTIPGALETLTRLGESNDLVVVTSRQHVIQDATLEWIDRHYPGVFQEVYFGNHFALEGVSRKKSEICRSIGAGVLIDDNPSYALECAEEGMPVLLYDWKDEYPWSKLPPGKSHPLITVVQDWAEVELEIRKLTLQTNKSSQ